MRRGFAWVLTVLALGVLALGFIGKAYYARVKRVVKKPGDHKHVCKGDRSPTIE